MVLTSTIVSFATLLLSFAPLRAAAIDNTTVSKMQRLCPHHNGGVLRFWQNANAPCLYNATHEVVAPLNELIVVPEGCTADPYTFPKCPSRWSESSWPACNLTIPETQDNFSQSYWIALNMVVGLAAFPVFMYRIYKFRKAKKVLSTKRFLRLALVQQWALGGVFAFSFILSSIDPGGYNGVLSRRFAGNFLVECRTGSITMFVSKSCKRARSANAFEESNFEVRAKHQLSDHHNSSLCSACNSHTHSRARL